MSVHGSYPPLLLLIIELPGIFSMTNSDRRNMSSPYQNFIDQIEIHSLTSSSAVYKTTLSELPQVVGRPLYPRLYTLVFQFSNLATFTPLVGLAEEFHCISAM